MPRDALALLPGEGDAGAALVRHPGVQTIAFTGSAAVGLEIVRAAAEAHAGQRHLKRVVAEMGGKNCIVVDADADLDEAVPAIVARPLGTPGRSARRAPRARPRGDRRHAARAPRGAVEVLSAEGASTSAATCRR